MYCWRVLQWHRAVSMRLCSGMALVDFVSLGFNHKRVGLRMHENVPL